MKKCNNIREIETIKEINSILNKENLSADEGSKLTSLKEKNR